MPPLILELRAKANQFNAEMQHARKEVAQTDKAGEESGHKWNAYGNTMAKVGKAVTFGLAGAAVAVGAVSVKMASDFQASTTLLVTGAGETTQNLAMIRSGLEAMAPQVGMGPDALAKAMFMVESAGYHGAQGLEVMKAAAEGAKIGGADATVVANGLTTAMTDYKIPVSQAATTTSQLVATVASGKTTMQALAGSLSNVLPAASAAHVGLSQVLGAMGTMTGEGISADQASQDLANTIRNLSNPSHQATAEMAQMGLNSNTVAQQLGRRGLTGTLGELTKAITAHMGPAGMVLQSAFNQSTLAAQSADQMLKQLPASLQPIAKGYLDGTVTQKAWTAALKDQPALVANLGKQFSTEAKHAHGFSDALKSGSGPAQTYNAALSKMLGGATGLNTALALTGPNMGTFIGNTKTIGSASAEAGGHVHGWSETQKDFKVQMDQARAGVEAMGIKIGMFLIPIVQDVIKIGLRWTNWLMAHKPVLIALAAVVGTVLVGAIGAYVASLAVAAVESVTSFAGMIGSAVAWATGTSAAAAEVEAAETAVAVTSAETGAATTLALGPIGLAIGAIVVIALLLAKHWKTVWKDIKRVVEDAVGFVKTHILLILTVALGPLGLAIGELVTHWRQVWGDIRRWLQDAWQFMQPIFNAVKTVGLDVIRDGVSSLESVWSTVWGAIQGVLSTAWSVLRPVFGFIKRLGLDWISTEVSVLGAVWNTIWNGIMSVVQTVWAVLQPIFATISSTVSGVISAFGKVAGFIGGVGHALFGGGGGGHAATPAHGIAGARAAGGPVATGLTYLVGETGPELLTVSGSGGFVTPLTSGWSAGGSGIDLGALGGAGNGAGGGSGFTIQVNLNGPIVGGSAADARALAEYLAPAIQEQVLQQNRRNGFNVLAGR